MITSRDFSEATLMCEAGWLFNIDTDSADLLPINRKSKQHIAGGTAGGDVARVDVQHPAADNGARPIERSAPARHCIHSRVGLFGIEIPDDLSVSGSVRAKMSIDCARKRDAADCRYGRGLSWAAPRPLATRNVVHAERRHRPGLG